MTPTPSRTWRVRRCTFRASLWKRKWVWWCFTTLLAFSFFFFRRDRILSLSPLNPDEAELLAGGKRAAISLVPYEKFTTATYGPAWTMLLGIARRIGLPLSIPVAHVLSAALGATVGLMLLRRVRLEIGRLRASLLLLPLLLYWAQGFNHNDFFSLANEILPLLFVVLAALCLTLRADTALQYVLTALFLGLAAWTKYSFAILALVVLLITAKRWAHRAGRPVWRLATVAVVANVWPIGLVCWAKLSGVDSRLFSESIVNTWEYILGGGGGGLGASGTPGMLVRFSSVGYALLSVFPLVSVLVAVLSVRYSVAAQRREIARRNSGSYFSMASKLLEIDALLTATFLSVFVTYPIFPHYNHLLLGGLFASLVIALAMSRNGTLTSEHHLWWTTRAFPRTQMAVALLVVCLVAPLLGGVKQVTTSSSISNLFSSKSGTWERAWDRNEIPLSQFCPHGSSVFVWGWSAELYSFYAWEPASRYVTTGGLMTDNKLSQSPSRTRKNLVNELRQEPPRCIVDATGPSFFPGYGPESRLACQMPRLWRQLRRKYEEMVFYWDSVNPVSVLVARDLATMKLEGKEALGESC